MNFELVLATADAIKANRRYYRQERYFDQWGKPGCMAMWALAAQHSPLEPADSTIVVSGIPGAVQ